MSIKDFAKRSVITDFCIKRGVPQHMRDAFNAYVHSVYSDRLGMKDTDTLALLISRLTDEQISSVWVEFVKDVRKILPTT